MGKYVENVKKLFFQVIDEEAVVTESEKRIIWRLKTDQRMNEKILKRFMRRKCEEKKTFRKRLRGEKKIFTCLRFREYFREDFFAF